MPLCYFTLFVVQVILNKFIVRLTISSIYRTDQTLPSTLELYEK